jgi:hypothetical protein
MGMSSESIRRLTLYQVRLFCEHDAPRAAPVPPDQLDPEDLAIRNEVLRSQREYMDKLRLEFTGCENLSEVEF